MATDDDLRRVADKAATEAIEKFSARTPSMQDIEKLVDKTASRAAQEAAAEAAKTAVAQTLIGFGLDPNNRVEILKDMMFLSEMRSLSAASKKHVLLAVLGVMVTAIITGTLAYLKAGGKL